MIKINVEHLIKALNKAENFSLPGMNSGLHYLYEKVYTRLSSGEEVALSEITFNSFNIEDLDSLWKLYNEVLDDAECKADRIANVLHDLQPVAVTVTFA